MKHSVRGLTLFELLITFSMFTMIMSMTLYFYGQGIKATHRHDQGSEVYRRASKIFSKIENVLHSGTLVHVTDTALIFSPYNLDQLLTAQRTRNWNPVAHSLLAGDGGLSLFIGQEKTPFLALKKWEWVSFQAQQFPPDEDLAPNSRIDWSRRFDYVDVAFSSSPPSTTRGDRVYKFYRQILLVRY